jgi:hypothetical protein
MLGQVDLGAHIEISTQKQLWSIQRKVSRAISVPRAKVVVPSCNASGKTHLAARLALAFYDSFKPGVPCAICKGPCGGCKIITTSSKWDHLSLNLWGEIRIAYPRMVDNVGFDGRLMPGDLKLEGAPNWWVIGQVAEKEEAFQGHHAAHKLIIGDEATSINDAVSHGITGLLASGDTRLLLILNPTTADTYAANMSRSPGVETIRIRAWDTPEFTDEDVPDGSNLITPRFLEELKAQGMGPGTYEWETRVEAKFWDMADDNLIAMPWVTASHEVQGYEGVRALGIDMATFGSNENVITYRDGNEIVWQRIFPSMPQETFWEGPVTKAVEDVEPNYVIYDADGVGAGVSGYAENVQHRMTRWGGAVLPFRGAIGVEGRFRNARSMWWWALRRRLEAGGLAIRVRDPKLEQQLTQLRYTITNTGEIRIETKLEMRKRNLTSPDRADSLMYACALAEDLPLYEVRGPKVASHFGVQDSSEAAMWARQGRQLDLADGRIQGKRPEINPVLGCPDDY